MSRTAGTDDPLFNDVIHSSVRLRICGLLRQTDELEFHVLRDALDMSDPTLSKHLKVLADAGIVQVRKKGSRLRTDARRLTWVALTPAGAIALRRHMAAVIEIAG